MTFRNKSPRPEIIISGIATYIARTYENFCNGLNFLFQTYRKRRFFSLEHTPGIISHLFSEIRPEILFFKFVIFTILVKGYFPTQRIYNWLSTGQQQNYAILQLLENRLQEVHSFPVYCMLMPVRIRIITRTAFNKCHSLIHLGYKYILLFGFICFLIILIMIWITIMPDNITKISDTQIIQVLIPGSTYHI